MCLAYLEKRFAEARYGMVDVFCCTVKTSKLFIVENI